MNRWRIIFVGAAIGAAVAAAPTKSASARPVTLTITEVEEIRGNFDNLSDADFYPQVSINNVDDGQKGEIDGENHIFPNWQFIQDVPINTAVVPVHVIVRDSDGFLNGSDDLAADFTVQFNTQTGKWTGDVTSPNNCYNSPLDPGAKVCFTLTTPLKPGCLGGVASNTDTDGDGLIDCWEDQGGIDYDGDGVIDLALPGGSSQHKDLYVEVDYMAQHQPDQTAMNAVVAAFATAPNAEVHNPDGRDGVNLHVIVDEQVVGHTNAISFPATVGVGGGCTQPNETGSVDFDTLKASFFGTATERAAPNASAILAAKKLVFRYVLFAHHLQDDNNTAGNPNNTSGCSELPGNDSIVSLGGWAGVPDQAAPAPSVCAAAPNTAGCGGCAGAANLAACQQIVAGTFMHEFGHTLNLHHGGAENLNCKPNYLSVMSYTRQINNVFATRALDYSHGNALGLNETSLNETLGIGAGFPAGTQTAFGPSPVQSFVVVGGGINWNRDVDLTGAATLEVNVPPPGFPAGQSFIDIDNLNTGGCGSTTAVNGAVGGDTSMKDFDDWAALLYDFTGTDDFADGSRTTATPAEMNANDVMSVDDDLDGIPNAIDNCVHQPNFDQQDCDHDGQGDACQIHATGFTIGDILAFESAPNGWSAPKNLALLTRSCNATQGSASLQVKGGGYIPIVSTALDTTTLVGVTGQLAYDLFIPAQQPNPFWIGATQMFVSIPSANVYNAYLGQVELTNLPEGRFDTVAFTIPSAIVAALKTPHTDLTFTIVLNINAGSGAFLTDNLRFLP